MTIIYPLIALGIVIATYALLYWMAGREKENK
jgi:hypothetical protein